MFTKTGEILKGTKTWQLFKTLQGVITLNTTILTQIIQGNGSDLVISYILCSSTVALIYRRLNAEASKFEFTRIEVDVTVLNNISKCFILNVLACVNIPIHSFIFYVGLNTVVVIYQLSAKKQFDIHTGKPRSIAMANRKSCYGCVEVSDNSVFCLKYLHL